MKKLSKTTKVLRYVQKYPLAKAKEVALAVGVSVNTVYQVVHLAKKKLENGQVVSTLVPNAEMSLALFGDKEIQKASETVHSVTRGRGTVNRPPRMLTAERMREQAIEILKATDEVNHPPHYKVGGIETIDFIEAKSLNYNLGNVIKYLTRADHKGNRKQDLEKALWYLNREIEVSK